MKKYLFDFYTKELGRKNKPVHFGREEMTLSKAKKYAKEFDLLFTYVADTNKAKEILDYILSEKIS